MDDPAALQEVARLVGLSQDEVTAQVTSHFQSLSEQIARGLNKGLYKLIKNLAMRMLWSEYGMPEEVKVATFLTAVGDYLSDQLHLSEDAVAAILTDDNKVALASALDGDGDGKVRERHRHCQWAAAEWRDQDV